MFYRINRNDSTEPGTPTRMNKEKSLSRYTTVSFQDTKNKGIPQKDPKERDRHKLMVIRLKADFS